MPSVAMKVNGKDVSAEVENRTLLVQYLRDYLNMTGTHVGCDTSQCGCCVVHVNGSSVKSCTMLAVQAEGADVVTIEGLADGESGVCGSHDSQRLFLPSISDCVKTERTLQRVCPPSPWADGSAGEVHRAQELHLPQEHSQIPCCHNEESS